MAPIIFDSHCEISSVAEQALMVKTSYVKREGGQPFLVEISNTGTEALDYVSIPSIYETPLHVLSYRYQLEKCTIILLSKSLASELSRSIRATMLAHLQYLDCLKDRFREEAKQAFLAFKVDWRCADLDFYLWLDFHYLSQHNDAREALENQYNITFESIAAKKQGSDIFTKCMFLS